MGNIKNSNIVAPVGGKSSPADQPRGSVLVYTIVVLLLMTLMGAALMVNSRTELQISGYTAQGRDAFTKADATARVALLVGRAFLHPVSGDPRHYRSVSASGAGKKTFDLTVDDGLQGFNDFQQIDRSFSVQDIANRYLTVTEAQGKDKPHILLTYGLDDQNNKVVVGTSYISLAFKGTDTGGGSIGERDYSTPDAGYYIRAFFVISSQGRVPQDSDNKSYFEEKFPGTHSIITTIYREIIA